MLLEVQDLLGNYQKTGNACNRGDGNRSSCDAMVLGSILKATQNARLWPIPEPPYKGFTVEGIKRDILAFEIKTLCDITHPSSGIYMHKADYNYQYGGASYTIKESIAGKINSLSDMLHGLKIEDFK